MKIRAYRSRKASSALIAVALIAASACGDEPPVGPELRTAPVDVAAILREGGQSPVMRGGRGVEDAILELDRETSGVGGMYTDDDGALVVLLTETGDLERARRGLEAKPNLRGVLQGRGGAARSLRSQVADYRFTELVSYHDAVVGWASEIPGMLSVDADERRNRVVIGVSHPSARGTVQRRVRDLGLPVSAFEFRTVTELREAASIRDHFRPTAAGMQIRVRYNTAFNLWTTCTMGFNVKDDADVRFALTAAHCAVDGGTGSTYYVSNPAEGSTSNRIGYVEHLPPTWSCSGGTCRHSDALLLRYYATVASPARMVHPSSSGGTSSAGTLNRNTSDDVWTIGPAFGVGVPPYFVGDTLHKVGRTTGWTTGPVTATCETWFNEGVFNVCQDRLFAYVDFGDSGGPVIQVNPNLPAGSDERIPRGIVWGKLTTGSLVEIIFSTTNNLADTYLASRGPLNYSY
jgi:hypothetical protein